MIESVKVVGFEWRSILVTCRLELVVDSFVVAVEFHGLDGRVILRRRGYVCPHKLEEN